MAGDVARNDGRLAVNADLGAPHPAVAQDLGQDMEGGIAGDGKADALGAGDDRRC